MLEPDATKAEVLAAVNDSEQRLDDVALAIDLGLVTVTRCGSRGPSLNDRPDLVRQRAAGEEDQCVPGWDQGA